METKEWQKDVFKSARTRDKRTRDLGNIRCIKGDDSKVSVEDARIREKLQSFFSELLNGELREYSWRHERGIQKGQKNYRFCSCISKEEVRDALRKMKTGKAIGSYRIPIEVWKHLDKEGLDS